MQKASDTYKILINDEKDLENKRAESITDEMKRLYLLQLKYIYNVMINIYYFTTKLLSCILFFFIYNDIMITILYTILSGVVAAEKLVVAVVMIEN